MYPKDTIIRYPDRLKFDILTDDKRQDIFEQEKPIEEAFKQTFRDTDYTVKADFYMSSPNPPKLGYHVTIDCDSSFLKQFNPKLLSKNDLFLEMSEFIYINKTFDIIYFQWK